MEYGISNYNMVCRYGHPGYRYGIWANDLGEDRINTVILDIHMGYLVTLLTPHMAFALDHISSCFIPETTGSTSLLGATEA